jgi:hypothetical protein
MDTEEASPSKKKLAATSRTTIPAKRNADGVVVKKEPTEVFNKYRD